MADDIRPTEHPTAPRQALRDLWLDAGGAAEALDAARLTGAEPALPSSFAVGTAAQAAIAASALASAEVGRLRSGVRQHVAVDMRHAAIEFRSERYLRVAGEAPPDPWDRIAGLYRCGDGGWTEPSDLVRDARRPSAQVIQGHTREVKT